MMESPVFEVSLHGTYGIVLPERIVAPFLEAGQKRVEVFARHAANEVRFHAALQKRKGLYRLIFGKRHQKELGIFPNDFFKIQLREDQTEFGVEIPEELGETFRQWPEAYKAFLDLTEGSKRSVIYAISRYRTPQTRVEKALQVGERLVQGVRKPRDLFKAE